MQDHDSRHQSIRCPGCQRELHYTRYHEGFNNEGYMYCDMDATVVRWSTFDERYRQIVDDKHPWVLDSEERNTAEY